MRRHTALRLLTRAVLVDIKGGNSVVIGVSNRGCGLKEVAESASDIAEIRHLVKARDEST